MLNFWTLAATASAAAGVAAVMISNSRKKRKARAMRVNPYLAERGTKGRFVTAFDDMTSYPPAFKENFHMDINDFEDILGKIYHRLLPKRNTRPDDGISPREKLAITLEYLASGSFERHVASSYRVSKSALGSIITSVCEAIHTEMSAENLPRYDKNKWIETANRFHEKWNFPNCLGAIDGKHIAIKCPPNAGSLFFNYKKFHSIVLMGIADADYRFSYVNIGAYGSEGDAGVFAGCQFGRKLIEDSLSLPEDSFIGPTKIPYFFIGDDAFPLCRRIMKPFTPRRGAMLAENELLFNYRLSRARRCIENAFGILSARWLCLSRTMFCFPEKAQMIVSACIILHNYLMRGAKASYCPVNFADTYDANGNLIGGQWRNNANQLCPLSSNRAREQKSAVIIRNHLKDYVNSNEGAVPWQRKAVFLSER